MKDVTFKALNLLVILNPNTTDILNVMTSVIKNAVLSAIQ